MVSGTKSIWLTAGLAAVTALAACGGNQDGSGPNPETVSVAPADPSGNEQSGTAGGDLPAPLRIVVMRSGAPAAGVVVSWNATGVGAFMTPRIDTTDANGISSSIWHLGSDPGPQSAQATVAGGAGGSPVFFGATARTPDGAPAAVTIRLLSSGGNRFDPETVTIPAGTTVTWSWVDGFHNVVHDVLTDGVRSLTSSGNPVESPQSYSFTFTTPGVYSFFCEVHGTLTTGMHGTVIVQ
jgi:plastocyanin